MIIQYRCPACGKRFSSDSPFSVTCPECKTEMGTEDRLSTYHGKNSGVATAVKLHRGGTTHDKRKYKGVDGGGDENER